MLKKISHFLIWLIALSPCVLWFQDINRMVFPRVFIFRIFVELLLICYLILLSRNKISFPKFNFINISFISYVCIAIITGFIGIDPGHSFWSTIERYLSNFDYIHFALLLLILPCFLNSKEKWLNFLKRLNFSYLIISLFYYFCFLFNFFQIRTMNTEHGRWMGFAGNSIFMSVFLLINIFFSFYLFFEDVEKNKKNYITLISGLIFTFLIFQTGSRGSLLALSCSVFLLFLLFSFFKYDKFNNLFRVNNQKIGKWILVITIMLICLIFGLRNTSFIKNIAPLNRLLSTSIKNISVANRLAVTRTSIMALTQKPLLGWGINNYDTAYQNNFDPEMVAVSPQEFRFDKAHNMFLEVGVGMGIFGLLSYIFVYYSAHYSLKTMNEDTIGFFPKLILVFLVLSYAIQNLFVFDVFDGLIPFLIFLAFVSTLSGVNKENSKPNQFKNIICILIIPFLLFSIHYFNIREIGFLNGYRHTTSYLREFTVLQDIQVLSRFKRPFTPLQEKILKEDREYILSLIQNHPTRWRPYVFICYIIGLQYEYKNIPKSEIDLIKQTYLQAKQYKVTLPDYERQYNLVLKGSADIQDQKEAALNIFFLIQKYPSLDWKTDFENSTK